MITLTDTELEWIITTMEDKADHLRKSASHAETAEELAVKALSLHYAETFENLSAKLRKSLDNGDKRIAIIR